MSNDLFIFLYTRNGYKYCNIPAMLEQYSRIIGLESIGWEKSNTKIEKNESIIGIIFQRR